MPPAVSPLVLAVDLGTSALKAGLCSADGAVVALAVVELSAPASGVDGSAEADAREWVDALVRAARQLGSGGAMGRVAAVVVSGHGPSLVAVGRDGRALRPAMLWLDRRATAEAAELSSAWGRRIEPWHFLPKALWLARREPAVWERSVWLMSSPEYLAFGLTGEAWTVLHTQSFRHYYWTDEVARSVGLDPSRFPPFVAPGEAAGRVRAVAAADLGIAAGTPVVAGGPDFLMSLLGTACVAPGRGCDRAGSSEAINVCAARSVSHPRLTCHPHVVAPWWNVAGMIPASGLAVSWLRSVVGARESVGELYRGLDAVPPGSRGLLFVPFGPEGGTASFAGLGLQHGPREMARAVVESVAFQTREVLDAMREQGLEVGSLTVTGGQARAEQWLRIKAEACGIEVRVPSVAEAELLGGAVLGFVSLGAYPCLREAAERMVRISRTVAPDPRAAALYTELYGLHRLGLERLTRQGGSSSSR